jgi:hypothetical protein
MKPVASARYPADDVSANLGLAGDQCSSPPPTDHIGKACKIDLVSAISMRSTAHII